MAVFIKPSSGAKTSRRSFTPMAEINVTPMVDVMLVLLVIFIVTAPLLTTGVNVKLPQTTKTKSLPQDNKALTLYVERDGTLTLNESKLDLDTLTARLEGIREANPEVRIYVKGDKDVAYGQMMQVMAAVTAAGITQVAFVTEPPKSGAKKK
ncbi:MAG: ExbD/TolR family protein [Rhodospirillaceae bacterium]|nr:ExbD/TolR family protein [Rhodospirillaceae bacterium]